MGSTPAAGPVAGARYVVDPTHTFVMYEMGHYGTSTNRGRFGTRSGEVRVAADGTQARVEIQFEVASVNTGVDLLNRHLQSKDFFDVANHSTARFVAEAVRIADGRIATLDGQLTLLGRTHPVAIRVLRFNCYTSPLHGRQVCGGDFEGEIQRSLWGMDWGLQFGFEDRVRLLTQLEAVLIGNPPAR
ncbi:YceI family protein [Pseudorhodoferax sp.]|uniref:YceI family protein n=1 Tax=Pseudorhodoferax sp. TaxID=1993553 RepID=UPI002DD628AC|nr:YceI family protein [Pseudorhodoferax sp.]